MSNLVNPFIDNSLVRLATSRRRIETQRETIQLLQEKLEANDLFQQIKVEEEQLTHLVSLAKQDDENVRRIALDIYERDTDSKTICDGVSIAEHTTFNVIEGQAIAWASEHHHKGLKLNLTEIKKVAKAGMEVDGVVLGKENRVKIASDLSSYLTDSE